MFHVVVGEVIKPTTPPTESKKIATANQQQQPASQNTDDFRIAQAKELGSLLGARINTYA